MSADVQSMPNGFPLGDAPGLTSPHRSDKDKSDKDRSKHKKSKKEKHRDRSKERKHKDKKKDKSKDKDRSEKKDKDKKKHKHDKDRDREKEKKNDKERDEKKKENNHHAGKNEVKEEVERGLSSSVVKEENNSNLDFSANSDYQRSPSPSSRPKKKAKYSDDEDEDEDEHYVGEDDEDEDYDEKPAASASKGKKRKGDDEDDDFKPASKKAKTDKKSAKKSSVKNEAPEPESPKKGRKKKEDEEEHQVWKWWEEEKKEDGVKWKFLEHKGPVFAPLYERLPPNVKFYYDGKEMKLSEEAEEVATFYAKMLTHDYTTKEAFNKNFFKDWRKFMTDKEKDIITDLSKCDFRKMNEYFTMKSEERKAMSKEEKKAIKEENEKILKEYGFCTIDGHKEKIGNFKVEPPSLFRGRGEHPKMGKVKRRIQPEDVIINCSKDSKIPVPPAGHKWKEIRHDNTVTWLCSWTENIQGQIKYIMLNPSSKLKGEKDWQKYETARKLHRIIDRIREDYWGDMKSKEMRIRQRAVAMYLIDKLALRAGNEKEEGETADTVGCCSLRYEHVSLHEHKNGKDHVVGFDFLGKDSIRYSNEVSVEKRVFKNLQLFMENKNPGDDLFDRLNTSILNKHLQSIMDGLTAKVFRTYNASRTLQEQLDKLTDPDDTPAGLILSYNRANRAVAILCNHQRAVPKSHAKSMENLQNKIQQKEEQIREAEKDLKGAKKDLKDSKSQRDKIVVEKKSKALERLREQLMKLNVQATDKEENKEIALGTSKLNYLDPRISVAWCKKYNVPIEKVYSKTHRMKFRWAIDMAGPDFVF